MPANVVAAIRLPASAAGLVALIFAALAAPAAYANHGPAASTLQYALAELRSGRPERAAQLAYLLATHPHAPQTRAWLVVAAARQAAGDFSAAADAWQKSLPACRDSAERNYVLTQLAICRRNLQPSPPTPPPSTRLTPDQRESLAVVHPQPAVESTHRFIVHSNNPQLSRLIADHAESTLRQIAAVIMGGVEYPHLVNIIVHPSPDHFPAALLGGHHRQSLGAFEINTDELGFVHRTIHLAHLTHEGTFDADLVDRVLPHELCHLVLTEWFGDAHCPLYLQEGLAMIAEHGQQDSRIFIAAAAMARNAAIPLQNLISRDSYDPEQADLFYAQSYCLLAYLQQRLPLRQFVEMLQHLKHGCSLREALARTLLISEDEHFMFQLESAWHLAVIEHAQFLAALRYSSPTTPLQTE